MARSRCCQRCCFLLKLRMEKGEVDTSDKVTLKSLEKKQEKDVASEPVWGTDRESIATTANTYVLDSLIYDLVGEPRGTMMLCSS